MAQRRGQRAALRRNPPRAARQGRLFPSSARSVPPGGPNTLVQNGLGDVAEQQAENPAGREGRQLMEKGGARGRPGTPLLTRRGSLDAPFLTAPCAVKEAVA